MDEHERDDDDTRDDIDTADGWDGDGHQDDANRGAPPVRTLLGAVRDIVGALADAQRTDHPPGRRSRPTFSAEYSIESDLGPGRPSPTDDRTSPGSGDSTGSSTDSIPSDDQFRVDTRYDEDTGELLVIADLPAVDVDELTVGLDRSRNELVIGVGDRPVERLELPWQVTDVDSRFRNGILELRIAREGNADE